MDESFEDLDDLEGMMVVSVIQDADGSIRVETDCDDADFIVATLVRGILKVTLEEE